MKLRSGDPWMPADVYGQSLRGLSVNLLVCDMARAIDFQQKVLGTETVYHDPDFAVCRYDGAEWMLHADHTYKDHPLHGSLAVTDVRGIGCELRIHGRDPDKAEEVARSLDYTILAGAMDKPHGLREAFILDADGYVWVPDVPVRA